MTFSPRQYATAFLNSFLTASPLHREKYIKNFLILLHKHKKYHLLPAILVQIEKISLKRSGKKKIVVESAAQISDDIRKQIIHAAGGSVLLEEKVDEKLLAGMKLTLDDSILIDATGKYRINALFR